MGKKGKIIGWTIGIIVIIILYLAYATFVESCGGMLCPTKTWFTEPGRWINTILQFFQGVSVQ